MSEDSKYIIDLLKCEYILFENEKDDEKLIKTYNEWSKIGPKEGFYPLIIVSNSILAENLEYLVEESDEQDVNKAFEEQRKDILEKAKNIDVENFLKERYAEYLEMHNDENIFGEFLELEPSNSFYSYMESDGISKDILLVKIPTKNPWEMAAWLPMGGFNDCPLPEEQVAVFKYWYEKYRAVPAVVTYDNWEMELEKPPLTNEDAYDLAKEQFSFCYDIVMQASTDFATIKALASSLKNSHTWYFWWD